MCPFNSRLKAIRKEHGSTQAQVYSAIGISASNYQSFEYGRVKPSFDTLIALADYFDISLDYLVGRSEDPKRY